MEQFETKFKQVDVFSLVKHYMDQLSLVNLFKKYITAANGNRTDHAESLCIMIANIICDNKPLYEVQEWLSKYSEGVAEKPSENRFNDDRLGRALSALFQSDRHSLMTELSSTAIRVHQLLTNDVHNDTTTITFKGNYNNPDPEAVKFKHGHNKDFRPDCKQIVFGLNITADGHVPLSFNLFDGNTPDDITHIPNWNALRGLLKKEDFVYVADCKLCSQDNLNHIAGNGGQFITIVPKDRVQVKRFKKNLVKKEVEWKYAFKTQNSRKKTKSNIYSTYELKPDKKGFRTILKRNKRFNRRLTRSVKM